jgi:muramoyltetrapeptide carboxypeptidase
MANFVKPPVLNTGDKVAIVAPSGVVDEAYVHHTANILRNWGLEVEYGANMFAKHHQFAGSDVQRLADLQWALDDEEVKAVLCARGGYGVMRILDKIHWHKFEQNPKWLAGFSDITALHSAIHLRGIQSLHSVMPINISNLNASSKMLELFGTALYKSSLQYTFKTNQLNRTGTEKAVLAGGNLSLLYALAGTDFDINLEGKILFIEDVGEHYYHIDRMMQSLRLAGKLEKLSGLIVGGLTEMMDDKRPFGRSPQEIISDAVEGFDYPVVFDFPGGHIQENSPLILGAETAVEVNSEKVIIHM